MSEKDDSVTPLSFEIDAGPHQAQSRHPGAAPCAPNMGHWGFVSSARLCRSHGANMQ